MVPAPTGKGSVIVPSPTPTRDLGAFRYQLNTLKAQNTKSKKRIRPTLHLDKQSSGLIGRKLLSYF